MLDHHKTKKDEKSGLEKGQDAAKLKINPNPGNIKNKATG